MEPEKKPDTEKKPEASKKPEKSTPSKPLPSFVKWIIAVVIFIVLLIGAVILGKQAERMFGNSVAKMLPQNLISKWTGGSMPVLEEKKLDTKTVTQKPQPTASPVAAEESPPSDAGAADLEAAGFILPFSNTRKVVRDDLTGLTPWELKVARNEIYARHGRPFVHKDLSCYFAKQDWYTLNMDYSESSLSSLETANAVFILNYEKEIDSPLASKDSGCNTQ